MMRAVPWWIRALGASFVAYFALLAYCDIVRPVEVGLDATFAAGQMEVTRVVAGSPAARAGLAVGDVVERAGPAGIRTVNDWTTVDGYFTFDTPVPVRVRRGATLFDTHLVLSKQSVGHWLTTPGVLLLVALVVQAVSLSVAWMIVLKRPGDTSARLGALVLATMGVITLALPQRFIAVWNSVPWPLTLLFWVPHLATLAAPAVLCSFFASFPRELVRPRRWWLAIWAPTLVSVGFSGVHWAYALYRPDALPQWPWLGTYQAAIAGLYTAGALVSLIVNFRRVSDSTERRRTQVLLVGATAGLAPGFLVYASFWLRSTQNMAESIFASPWTTVGVLSALCIPASFMYAIVWHRLFEIRLIVRRGLQYALARRGLLSLVPALAGLIALDVTLQRSAPIATVARERGWAYALVAVGIVLAHANRERWLQALDRRFFREQYNAQRILTSVAEDLRRAASLDAVALRVVSHIDTALHPAVAALLVRDGDDSAFRTVASTPHDTPVPELGTQGTLLGLMRVLGRPVDVSSTGAAWLASQLPVGEVEALARSGVGLLVPITKGSGTRDAVLLLGTKRSEEPYSDEDRNLLDLIAGSLEPLLEDERRMRTSAVEAAVFEECPSCGACYDSGTGSCADDRVVLNAVPSARTLAARYHLERRLGQGGLGTVYAAHDTALDRDVAVKMIRHDIVASPALAKRFQLEAKLAASFVHPNVVTVHDFGASGAQAFLVMERLDGYTLRAAMKGGPLPVDVTLPVMRQVCSAVEAAHERRIVHRDLKPENIFLVQGMSTPLAKVLDFGVATLLSATTSGETSAGMLVGTLAYMSPELLRGEEPTAACDLWALAVIAYEMVAGSHPFARQVAAATAAPSGSERLAPAVRTFFTAALSPDPDRRFDSARRFLGEFERATAPL